MSCQDDIFCGVNTAEKPVSEMSDLEKKHTPVIDAPASVKKGESFTVTVKVGHHMAHPNENAHYIEWIDLYCGETYLCRASLVPRLTSPTVTFTVTCDHPHPLIAKTRCNLHGVWQSDPFEMTIED